MARTLKEIDALIDSMEEEKRNHAGALIMQDGVNTQTTRRFERLTGLLDRHNIRLALVEDQSDNNASRVGRVERQLDEIASPAKGLALGLVALFGWLILGFWLKSYIGGSARVWLDGQEILWNQHPDYGGLTTAIIGGVAVFIVVLTLVNVLLDMTSGPRQQPRPAPAEQPAQEEQANPPVLGQQANQPAEAEQPAQEEEANPPVLGQQANQPAQGNLPPQGGNQAGNNPPTQVMPQPVNAGQQP